MPWHLCIASCTAAQRCDKKFPLPKIDCEVDEGGWPRTAEAKQSCLNERKRHQCVMDSFEPCLNEGIKKYEACKASKKDKCHKDFPI